MILNITKISERKNSLKYKNGFVMLQYMKNYSTWTKSSHSHGTQHLVPHISCEHLKSLCTIGLQLTAASTQDKSISNKQHPFSFICYLTNNRVHIVTGALTFKKYCSRLKHNKCCHMKVILDSSLKHFQIIFKIFFLFYWIMLLCMSCILYYYQKAIK